MKLLFPLVVCCFLVGYILSVLNNPLTVFSAGSAIIMVIGGTLLIVLFYQWFADTKKTRDENNASILNLFNNIKEVENNLSQGHSDIKKLCKDNNASILNLFNNLKDIERNLSQRHTEIKKLCDDYNAFILQQSFDFRKIEYNLSQIFVMMLFRKTSHVTGTPGTERLVFEQDNCIKEVETGDIISVYDKKTDTKTNFIYDSDENYVKSEIRVNNKKKYVMTHHRTGNPVRALEYDDNGNVRNVYNYDEMGQLIKSANDESNKALTDKIPLDEDNSDA